MNVNVVKNVIGVDNVIVMKVVVEVGKNVEAVKVAGKGVENENNDRDQVVVEVERRSSSLIDEENNNNSNNHNRRDNKSIEREERRERRGNVVEIVVKIVDV